MPTIAQHPSGAVMVRPRQWQVNLVCGHKLTLSGRPRYGKRYYCYACAGRPEPEPRMSGGGFPIYRRP